MSNGQQKVIEQLLVAPATIQELMERTYLSDSFVRNTVRFLETTGQVEKTDNRVPYVYKIPENNPLIRKREEIAIAKRELLSEEEPISHFIKLFHKKPKENWPQYADTMEIIAIAIKELQAEGKLIETL